jgi:hypothetical protein
MYIITKKEGVSVTIHKTLARDPRLSHSSKGVFLYLASHLDMSGFTLTQISKDNNCGTQSVKTAIKELTKYGYVKYHKLKEEFVLNDNPSDQDLPKKVVVEKTKTTKPKKSIDEIRAVNNGTMIRFKNSAKIVAAELKLDPKYKSSLTIGLFNDFVSYWTEENTDKPEKGLRYESMKYFDMKRRLANFIRMSKDRTKVDAGSANEMNNNIPIG